ncbi:hypothetical protein B0T25DRAFT_2919 [Lasiosphaeria hispida]|uniref:Uncharacterized protein n=1 Tax=Lasiosphaeria hispida TaxID=260671 RepID=A0AAJ0MJ17_9PEZI|nr:hypothetical protein B0T25DRAFT_2919 [Lasiosphaeria hispida]
MVQSPCDKCKKRAEATFHSDPSPPLAKDTSLPTKTESSCDKCKKRIEAAFHSDTSSTAKGKASSNVQGSTSSTLQVNTSNIPQVNTSNTPQGKVSKIEFAPLPVKEKSSSKTQGFAKLGHAVQRTLRRTFRRGRGGSKDSAGNDSQETNAYPAPPPKISEPIHGFEPVEKTLEPAEKAPEPVQPTPGTQPNIPQLIPDDGFHYWSCLLCNSYFAVKSGVPSQCTTCGGQEFAIKKRTPKEISDTSSRE